MASAETPSSVITRFAALLEEASVPYMLTGSFASGIHGQPRASHDIDFVIAPTLGALHKLLDLLPQDQFYVSREAALDAYARESLFNVVDMGSGWKVDFICRKSQGSEPRSPRVIPNAARSSFQSDRWFGRGNSCSGGETPSALHSGPQPSPTRHSMSRCDGMAARTVAL